MQPHVRMTAFPARVGLVRCADRFSPPCENTDSGDLADSLSP